MSAFEIHSIAFDPDGLIISYIEAPTDVRVGGRLVKQHHLRAHASHPDYAEDAQRLHDRAVKVLRSMLEDFEDSEPHVPEDREDDDEKGMGE